MFLLPFPAFILHALPHESSIFLSAWSQYGHSATALRSQLFWFFSWSKSALLRDKLTHLKLDRPVELFEGHHLLGVHVQLFIVL